MKTNRLIDNRGEAGMLLKGKEKDARSSTGVIWNGISFEKMVIPAGGAHVPTVIVGIYATLGRYDVRGLNHYYGLSHLHYLTTSTYRRARLFDTDRKSRAAGRFLRQRRLRPALQPATPSFEIAPYSLASGLTPSQGWTCQISEAYSLMVRPEENFPPRATFRIALRSQPSTSR